MKKWLLGVGLVAVIGMVVVAGIFIFIPSTITIAGTVTGKCSINAASRYFSDTSNWKKWWPDSQHYRISGVYYNHVGLLIPGRGDSSIAGNMRIVQLSYDSVLIGLEYSYPAGDGVLTRVAGYRHKQAVRESVMVVLKRFQAFLEDPENVYGVAFQHTMSKDSVLVTLTGMTAGYPGTEYIYRVIDSLRQYAAGSGAKEINYPMMNVKRLPDNRCVVMVGLSLDKLLPGDKRIIAKRFVPWKMIEGEVHGGVHSIDEGFESLFRFRDDHHINIMAIPFQSLITDRRKEQDSTKWVTRISAPIS